MCLQHLSKKNVIPKIGYEFPSLNACTHLENSPDYELIAAGGGQTATVPK